MEALGGVCQSMGVFYLKLCIVCLWRQSQYPHTSEKTPESGDNVKFPATLDTGLRAASSVCSPGPPVRIRPGSQVRAGPRLKEMSIHSTGVHKDWCLSGPGLFGKQKCVYDYMSWSPVVESLLMYYQYFTWSLDGLPIWLPQSSYEVIRSSFV